MARPIWKGHITFGLVNIPITLYSAEKKSELHFNLLDSRDHSRVRYERVNETTGEEVPWDQIVKGYEYEDGSYVLLNDEDFKKASVEATQAIEIEDFVDLADIDYVYFDKPYYLVSGKKGEKGYALLRETLKRTNKVGIARVVIHTRQYLAALIPVGNALTLELLRFHHEIRDAEEFDLPGDNLQDYKITDKELDLAEQLVNNMAADWKPEKYQDEYRGSLMRWIEEKVESGQTEPAVESGKEEGHGGAEIIDIMDLLKKSVSAKGKQAGKSDQKSAARKKSVTQKKKAQQG